MNALRTTKKLVLVNANWFSFLSATLISISVSFYTGLFGGEVLPNKWKFILLSVILTFLSAICWGFIAWRLDSIQRSAISRRPQTVDEKTAWDTVMTINELRSFRRRFLIASLLGLVGLLFLPAISLVGYLHTDGHPRAVIPIVIPSISTNDSATTHTSFSGLPVSSNKQSVAGGVKQ